MVEAMAATKRSTGTAANAEPINANGDSAQRPRRSEIRGATPSRVGLRFAPVLPLESWIDIGRRVAAHSSSSLWWLGDWLVYGKYKYGRQYKSGIAATGLDYQTLRNYAVVARRFELSRRRDSLSFQHHAELCALPDERQDVWLDRAEVGRWSRNELRRRLHDDGIDGRSAHSCTVRVAVDAEKEAHWREAAAKASSVLEVWIVSTLDDAAQSVLLGPSG